MCSSIRVIVNPHSANGRTGRDWPALEKRIQEALGDFDTRQTSGPMEASALAREAARDGCERVIAVGGDGTLSEVVNGLFENGEPVAPEISVGHLTRGTGADFRRTLGIDASDDAAIEALRGANTRRIDIGVLRFVSHDGQPATRTFTNIASLGLGGWVDRRVNRSRFAKRFGGRFAFRWHGMAALAFYKNPTVRITVDEHFDRTGPVCLACVCNGQYGGGGMHFAPMAELEDGLLDVVIIGDASRRELVRSLRLLYSAGHVGHPKVTIERGRRIEAESVDGDDVLLDVDGEAPGRLPASFEVLPAALKMIC